MNEKHRLLSILSPAVTIAVVVGCQSPGTGARDLSAVDVEKSATAPRPGDTGRPRVKLETTLGDIVIELDTISAPTPVLRFVRHVEEGLYDGTIFHRVLTDSMIHGGGYTPDMEPKAAAPHPDIPDHWQNDLTNKRGTIALIRATGGSNVLSAQFYINVVDNLELDSLRYRGTFTVFGRIVDGMGIVDAIRRTPVAAHPDYAGGQSAVVPVEPVVIRSARLLDSLDQAKLLEAAAAAQTSAQEGGIDVVAAKIAKGAGRGAVTTESGLRYVDIVVGTGAYPLATDTIEFNYRGTLIEGTEFESTFETEPAVRAIEKLVPGMREGLMSMMEGGRRTLIIPPELAFGVGGIPGRIPPDSTLIFEVELLTVR